MRLELGSGRALTRVIILSSHKGRHVWHVNLGLLLLPVFLDLILVEVLEAAFGLRGRVLLNSLVLLYHVSSKLVHCPGSLTDRLLLAIIIFFHCGLNVVRVIRHVKHVYD